MIAVDRLARLRAFAQEPGAFYFPISTRSCGSVPIFAEDILAAGADDAGLVQHIIERIGGVDQLLDCWRDVQPNGQNHTSLLVQ